MSTRSSLWKNSVGAVSTNLAFNVTETGAATDLGSIFAAIEFESLRGFDPLAKIKTRNSGTWTLTQPGTGGSNTFQIPHNLGGIPKFINVVPVTQAAKGNYTGGGNGISANAAVIFVVLSSAPAAGSIITFNWEASIF